MQGEIFVSEFSNALVGSENQIRAVDLAPNGDSADSCRVNEAVFGAGSRRD
jgi:hypothetical protein